MRRRALIAFAKPPEPGRVKTRLVPPLTAEDAAALYAGFVRDAARSFAGLGADVRWYVEGGSGSGLPFDPGRGDPVFAQRGEGLGPRMLHAFAESFAAGYDRVVIVGTDMPTLPADFIEVAFESLETPARTVVLGPAEDGGYYLLGLNHLYGRLFDGLSYSHERVFEEAVARAGELDAGLVVLPSWYDVDSGDDLERLRADLRERPGTAPETRAVLERLGLLRGAGA